MALFPLRVVFQSVTNIFTIGLFTICISSSCTHENNTENSLPFYNTADFTAKWINEKSDEYKHIHSINPFSFKDQNGEIFNSESLKGKIYVANFFFTICPSICPKMTNNLEKLQSTFTQETNFHILSFSVTPWIDSVERLKEYGEKHKINPSH